MKKIIKTLFPILVAISVFFVSIQIEEPIHTEQKEYSMSLNSNNAEAKGIKLPKPKPKAKIPPLHAKTRTHEGKKQVQATYNNSTKWITIKNGKLAGKKHPKTGVKFNKDGFPIFKSYGSITLPEKYLKSANTTQFKHSNLALAKNKSAMKKFDKLEQKLFKSGKTPAGYTWHHHQTRGYMQLVKFGDHSKTGHTGGKSIWGKK